MPLAVCMIQPFKLTNSFKKSGGINVKQNVTELSSTGVVEHSYSCLFFVLTSKKIYNEGGT